MQRRQFLRRTALFSLAATALPGIVAAADEPQTTLYGTSYAKLSNGQKGLLSVRIDDKAFVATDGAPFACTLVVEDTNSREGSGKYNVERTGSPLTEGDYTVVPFKIASQEGPKLLKGRMSKKFSMKLNPGVALLIEQEDGSFLQLNQQRSGCFLTTACTEARGLPDDCAELTLIRGLRDGHMRPSAQGQALVEEYYRIAPAIVRQVEARPNRAAIWDLVYTDLVLPSVELIQAGRPDEAVQHYAEYTSWMKEAFAPEVG